MAYDDCELMLFAVVGGPGFQLVTGGGTVVYESGDWHLFRRHLYGTPHDDDALAPAVRVLVGAPPSDVAVLRRPGRSDRALPRRTRSSSHSGARVPTIPRVPRCGRR